jgi:hypothetical protein
MHFAVSEILDAKAELKDEALKVRELFFSHESWTPEFVALDAGGWAHHDLALVGFSMVTGVDTEAGQIGLDIDRAALDAAPRMEGSVDPGVYQTLPPLLVGPFGATTAPLMMWAVASEDPSQPPRPEAHDIRADRIEKRFDRFTAWKGREVFGTGGPLGKLDDLLIDDQTRRITHMVIDRGMTSTPAVAPIGAFRHAAKGEEEYIVTDLTAEALDEAEPPASWTPRNKGWLSALRTY